MNASITIHMQDMPAEKCASVKLHAVEVSAAARLACVRSAADAARLFQAQSREALQAAWKQWVEEHGAPARGCSARVRAAPHTPDAGMRRCNAVAATGNIPAGNTPDVKDWTTRKAKATKCGRLPQAAAAPHRGAQRTHP